MGEEEKREVKRHILSQLPSKDKTIHRILDRMPYRKGKKKPKSAS